MSAGREVTLTAEAGTCTLGETNTFQIARQETARRRSVMPIDFPYTREPDRNAFYRRLVERAIEGVLGAAGEENVEALLMIGAPARSEATVVETAGGFFSPSDIDLLCLCRESADRSALRAAMSTAVSALNVELADSCGGVDVSLKTVRELASPHASISNYEMLRTPVVLWGDENAPAAFGEVRADSIPREESLVLVHNRIVEELLLHDSVCAAASSQKPAVMALYRTAKLALDSVTAILFLDGDVPIGYGDRVRLFLTDLLQRPEHRRLREKLDGFESDLEPWVAFKTNGDVGPIAAAHGRSESTNDLRDLARDLWHSYTRFADAVWRGTLGAVAGGDLETGDLAEVVRAYRLLESVPRSVARGLRMLSDRRVPGALFSRGRVLLRARMASPIQLAYLTAVLTYIRFGDVTDTGWLDQAVLTYCPFQLPPEFSSLDENEKRSALLDKLALFHTSVLLGREGGNA